MIALNKVDHLKPGHIATADGHGVQARRLPRAASGEREDRRRDRRAPRDELVELLPEGPAYFPPDQRSDLSVEDQVAELVREKALALTREEVPHAISVEVEELEEKVVRANLYVETESQKQILVGGGGAMVKEIGTRARPEIERAARPSGVPRAARQGASLSWRRDEQLLERLGI